MGREGQSRQAKKDGIEFSLREVPLGLGGFVHFQQNNNWTMAFDREDFACRAKNKALKW